MTISRTRAALLVGIILTGATLANRVTRAPEPQGRYIAVIERTDAITVQMGRYEHLAPCLASLEPFDNEPSVDVTFCSEK